MQDLFLSEGEGSLIEQKRKVENVLLLRLCVCVCKCAFFREIVVVKGMIMKMNEIEIVVIAIKA